jgi:hypothetical protein
MCQTRINEKEIFSIIEGGRSFLRIIRRGRIDAGEDFSLTADKQPVDWLFSIPD